MAAHSGNTSNTTGRGEILPVDRVTVRDTFLIRRPVFDLGRNLLGYWIDTPGEVSSESGLEEESVGGRGVVHTLLNDVGFDAISGFKDLMLNMDRRGLVERDYKLLPAEKTILGLMPGVTADGDELVAIARQVRADGYRTVLQLEAKDSVGLVDCLRPDIVQARFDLLANEPIVISPQGRRSLHFLLDGIDEHDQVDRAREAGATMISGCFFSQPQQLSRRRLSSVESTRVRLLAEINKPGFDADEIESLIKSDVQLPCGLLRYLNSASLGMRSRITSIRHAINLLGADATRRWCAVAAVGALRGGKPGELVTASLVRARLCENLAESGGRSEQALDFFMVGLLASIDALIDVPMEQALEDVPLSDDAKQALLGHAAGPLGMALGLAQACERGAWGTAATCSIQFGLTQREVALAYFDAVRWVSRQVPTQKAA